MPDIDILDEAVLRSAIRKMTNKWKLYKVLKQELRARGWWKNRKRGRHVVKS